MKTQQNFDDLLPEYHFDYSKAKPNRFAQRVAQQIELDEDVAQIFKTSEAVNHALRSILQALPQQMSA
jgi:hypothetical protein